MRKLSDMVINFLVRMVIGIVLIYFVNQFLTSNGVEEMVGINPVTAVISGTLGVPGVCLLYGIVVFDNF